MDDYILIRRGGIFRFAQVIDSRHPTTVTDIPNLEALDNYVHNFLNPKEENLQ